MSDFSDLLAALFVTMTTEQLMNPPDAVVFDTFFDEHVFTARNSSEQNSGDDHNLEMIRAGLNPDGIGGTLRVYGMLQMASTLLLCQAMFLCVFLPGAWARYLHCDAVSRI